MKQSLRQIGYALLAAHAVLVVVRATIYVCKVVSS